jgi:hypothetical protein
MRDRWRKFLSRQRPTRSLTDRMSVPAANDNNCSVTSAVEAIRWGDVIVAQHSVLQTPPERSDAQTDTEPVFNIPPIGPIQSFESPKCHIVFLRRKKRSGRTRFTAPGAGRGAQTRSCRSMWPNARCGRLREGLVLGSLDYHNRQLDAALAIKTDLPEMRTRDGRGHREPFGLECHMPQMRRSLRDVSQTERRANRAVRQPHGKHVSSLCRCRKSVSVLSNSSAAGRRRWQLTVTILPTRRRFWIASRVGESGIGDQAVDTRRRPPMRAARLAPKPLRVLGR